MSKQIIWLFKMAWRDSRRSRSRLVLFTASIIMGVAALVAINSFGDNLRDELDNQARTLLGADLSIRSNQAFSDSALVLMDSLGGKQANETNFASMVYFPKSEGTRLVQVRALEGDFPFYGTIKTEPASASRSFQDDKKALVDQTLMLQFGVEVGDSVKIGAMMFEIAGKLLRVPGQNGITATVSAPVYIPLKYLAATDLVKKGSRVNYQRYYQFEQGKDVEGMMETLKPRMRELKLRYDTVQERKESMGNAFKDMTQFLNLVGFIALLLGCVGVASAVNVYIKEKVATVAILRCLGAKGYQAFLIYLIQIGVMGLLGAILGAFLGTEIQTLLPEILREFLPFDAGFGISWPAIFQGIITGVAISILFALAPLLSIRRVSPLYALRASFESSPRTWDMMVLGVYVLIGGFVLLFTYQQMGSIVQAGIFSVSLGVAFLLLAGVAKGIMWLVRKYFPRDWSYLWRQSLANLYRPNNQTLTLIVSIGLGTLLISTLYFTQDLLLNKIDVADAGNRPNMVLFDIQTDQKEEISALTETYGFPVIQEVPIVTMRLAAVNGKNRQELLKDTTSRISHRTLNREFRVTFRDQPIESEEIIAGKWRGEVKSPSDSIFISFEEGYGQGNMGLSIGDEVVFNVQGVLIKTYVGSFRKVDFARVQTNFLVVFPKGVLEAAPQFHVLITKVDDKVKSADLQRTVAKTFPNVSIVDLGLILSTVEDLLGKVSFVIRFMALFSIITGLIVLIGSVMISKYQRVQESVLLRTLGASRRQILIINALEYFLLGSLAAATGILLSFISSWALAYFAFETIFWPDPLPALAVFAVITGLTVAIGMLNSRGVVQKPPLEILRNER